MKLSTKLTAIVLVSVIVIMVAVLAYLYLDRRRYSIEQAHSGSQAIARQNGALVESQMALALDSARTLAQALGGFQEYPVEGRRDVANAMLKGIAKDNPAYLGAWACFEPDKLDGLDAQFANTAQSDATGRFVSYWYNGDGGVKFSALTGYQEAGAGDYYLLALQSGKETVLEPFAYEVDGKSVLMTSFAVPVRDEGGAVVGVAGVDMTLDALGGLSFEKGDYQSAGFALLSNQGNFVVYPDDKTVGTNLSDAALNREDAQAMLEAIKAGQTFILEGKTALTGGVDSLITFVPVKLGDTGTPWSAEVAISQEEIMSKTNADGIMMILATLIMILAVALIVSITVNRMIKKPLAQIVEAAEQQAKGDFSQDIRVNRGDEIGALYHSLGSVNDNMNSLLADLRGAAEQVDAGARQISDSSVALAQGATEQASSIEELTASMEQVSAQTRINADNAEKANELAEKARQDAGSGNGQMEKLLAAMEDINASSQNISGIIKVIDDIAFQTNILALNAAVEAARAGEHGKGFAVVAGEVRSLAAKSAEAASEITRMIEESIKKVNGGGRIASETAQALNNIVAEVGSAAKLVNGIFVASGEQAIAISQINQGILQVSQVVQSNSATSQQTAAASEELTGQAENLMRQASHFKLREDQAGQARGLGVQA